MDSRGFRLGLVGMLLLVGIGAYLYLNRGYGEISELGYQYATALYSACNQNDDAKLGVISEMLAASSERREIEDRELRWLNGIIDLGRQGNWNAATREARKLLEDQVRGV